MSDKRENSGSATTGTGKGSHVGPAGSTVEKELRSIVLLLESIAKDIKNAEKRLDNKPKGIPGIHGKGK